jgi:hypothetical protein
MIVIALFQVALASKMIKELEERKKLKFTQTLNLFDKKTEIKMKRSLIELRLG